VLSHSVTILRAFALRPSARALIILRALALSNSNLILRIELTLRALALSNSNGILRIELTLRALALSISNLILRI